MSNDYALIDTQDPPRVVRLLPVLGSHPPEAGLTPVALPEPLAYWPEPPHAGAQLVWQDGALDWLDGRDLATARADQWEAIKRARDAAEFSRFSWDGSEFDADERAQARIQGAVQLATLAQAAGQPFAIDWTLADNTVRTLDAAQMLGVGMALAAHVQGVHATGRGLRAAIEAAEDLTAVRALSWPA